MSWFENIGDYLGGLILFAAFLSEEFVKLSPGPFWETITAWKYQLIILGLFIMLYSKWRHQKWIFYTAAILILLLTAYQWLTTTWLWSILT